MARLAAVWRRSWGEIAGKIGSSRRARLTAAANHPSWEDGRRSGRADAQSSRGEVRIDAEPDADGTGERVALCLGVLLDERVEFVEKRVAHGGHLRVVVGGELDDEGVGRQDAVAAGGGHYSTAVGDGCQAGGTGARSSVTDSLCAVRAGVARANSAPARMFGILLGILLFMLSTTRRAFSPGRVKHCPRDASAALKMSPPTVLHIMDNGYTTASNVHVDGGARLV